MRGYPPAVPLLCLVAGSIRLSIFDRRIIPGQCGTMRNLANSAGLTSSRGTIRQGRRSRKDRSQTVGMKQARTWAKKHPHGPSNPVSKSTIAFRAAFAKPFWRRIAQNSRAQQTTDCREPLVPQSPALHPVGAEPGPGSFQSRFSTARKRPGYRDPEVFGPGSRSRP